jgi:hypothetical protein
MTGRCSIRGLLGNDCPVVVVIDRSLDSLEILIDFHRIRGSVVQERIERADRIRCDRRWHRRRHTKGEKGNCQHAGIYGGDDPSVFKFQTFHDLLSWGYSSKGTIEIRHLVDVT